MTVIGKSFALGVAVCKLVFLFPATAIEQVVHVRAVCALCIAKYSQCGRLDIASVFCLIGQNMLAHKILFGILVRGGGEPSGFCQQLCLRRQQVAENAGQRHQYVNTRPTEAFQRRQLGTDHTPVTILSRLSTQ